LTHDDSLRGIVRARAQAGRDGSTRRKRLPSPTRDSSSILPPSLDDRRFDALRGEALELAAAHVLCLLDEVEGSAAHLEVNALPPRLRTRIVAKRDAYERGVRALVSAGVRAGTLRARDPIVATRAFLGALNWTAQWFRPEGPQSGQQVADCVADYAVAGLLNPIRNLKSAI
jgi:hypothetical protein